MPSYKIITDYPQKSEVYLDIVRKFRALLSGMAMVKNDGKTALVQTTASGEAVFCKRFRHGGIINSIKNQFRCSKAKMSYLAAKESSKRGIPVPEHLAAIEKHIAGFLINSYVIMRAVQDALPLRRYINSKFPLSGHYCATEKLRFINEFAAFLAKVHSTGMIHNDLKATNILVNEKDNNHAFYILDLDNVTFKKSMPMKIIVRNLVQLNNDCMYFSGGLDRLRFFLEYLKQAGLQMSRSDKHTLARKIENLTLKKVKRWQNEVKKLEHRGKLKHHDDTILLDKK